MNITVPPRMGGLKKTCSVNNNASYDSCKRLAEKIWEEINTTGLCRCSLRALLDVGL